MAEGGGFAMKVADNKNAKVNIIKNCLSLSVK